MVGVANSLPPHLTMNELALAVSGPSFPPGADIHWERRRELAEERRMHEEGDPELARWER